MGGEWRDMGCLIKAVSGENGAGKAYFGREETNSADV